MEYFNSIPEIYKKLQYDLAQFGQLQSLNKLEQIAKQFANHQSSLERAISSLGLAAMPFPEITLANEQLIGIAGQALTEGILATGLADIHKTWLDKLAPLRDAASALESSVITTLGNAINDSIISEGIFGKIDFVAMMAAMQVPEATLLGIKNSATNLLCAYEQLSASIYTTKDIARFPAYVLGGASREVLMTGAALKVSYEDFTLEEEDEWGLEPIIERGIELPESMHLLEMVDPNLRNLLEGAYDALRSDNPDRTRHCFVSLRELWSHLLHELAPDEDVLIWIGDRNNLVSNGRPTRRARILYICRGIALNPMSDFVSKDTDALLELIRLFNKIHRLNLRLSEIQQCMLTQRCNSWLDYILYTSFSDMGDNPKISG